MPLVRILEPQSLFLLLFILHSSSSLFFSIMMGENLPASFHVVLPPGGPKYLSMLTMAPHLWNCKPQQTFSLWMVFLWGFCHSDGKLTNTTWSAWECHLELTVHVLSLQSIDSGKQKQRVHTDLLWKIVMIQKKLYRNKNIHSGLITILHPSQVHVSFLKTWIYIVPTSRHRPLPTSKVKVNIQLPLANILSHT